MKGEQHVDALWKSVEKTDAAVLVMRVSSTTTHTGTTRARAKKSRENKFFSSLSCGWYCLLFTCPEKHIQPLDPLLVVVLLGVVVCDGQVIIDPFLAKA